MSSLIAKVLLPLPQWSEEDLVLLEKGELAVDASLFLDGPESLSITDAVVEKEHPVDKRLSMLPEKFLTDYFGKKNAAHLIDPQRLLTNPETLDKQGYLKHLANESEIEIRLFLFDGYQAIPSEHSLTRLAEDYYAEDSLTALVFYFLGNPQRNEILLIGQGSQKVTYRQIEKMMETASIKALEKSNDSSQMEDYIEQLSISLFWVEKDLLEAKKAAQKSKTIPENIEEEKNSTEKHSEKLDLIVRWLCLGGGIFFFLVILFSYWILWRRRRRYILSVLQVPQRLGAQYGAGIGAVVCFSDKTQSPGNQRKKKSDLFTGL